MKRRQLLLAGVAAAAGQAIAQDDFPSKAVRIVVPFAAGGVADLTVRAVGQKLAERLGQPVVIDNRPGAGGVVAGDLVAKAEPDGHTLLLMSNGTAVSAGLFKSLPFDARRDFAPVSLLGLFDLVIVVPEDSRFKTLGQLLAWGRANPGKLNLGSINAGSTQHLAAELFKSAAGLDAQVVPFNGTPAVVAALRGGQVDVAVEILSPVMAQISGKALRGLAVLGEKRAPSLPEVPTVAENGGALARFNTASWNALAAPARTPREVIAKLNREVRATLEVPEVRERLLALRVEPRGSTPEQLGQLLSAEIKRWGEVIARAGIPRQ